MESFAPLLIVLFFWIVIGIPASIAKKNTSQKKAAVRPAAPGKPAEQKVSPAPSTAVPERLTTLTPTISVTEHDDSIYQGSLNADTGEGYDPCHDEQLSALSTAKREPLSVPSETAPGFQLGWSGNEIVRGFVMGEILTRRKSRAS